ncbi:MAG: Stk1 family PASTA domain-containing Ser/Thr kinase [Actinomycetota bacterium]
MRLMRDLVGDVLSDRYRLIARLAGGGMGEVYRGHDLLLDRAVAVKILQPSLASDAELVERFKGEARAAARLSHPGVVAVYDWGAEDELTYYMVMEYVSGSDLRDLLVARGSLLPAQAAEITVSMCDALFAAHRQGLIHRDVKPENVLIARDGAVKVADFGIAVIADAERTLPGGNIPGTLRYLSPEQIEGAEASVASDIWAAGAVLFELLTGLPPLQGTGADLMRRRASEPPVAPSSVDPSLPRALDRIVLKACALDPQDRFGTAAEMAEALGSVASSLEPAAPVASLVDDVTGEISLLDASPTSFLAEPRRRGRRKARRLPRVAALVAILVLLAMGAAWAVPSLLGPRMVDVPRLVGLSHAEADQIVENEGLTIKVVGRDDSFAVAEGHVLRQTPMGGTLEEGSTVRLVISTGLPMRRVPDIRGMDLSAGRDRLEAAGFEPGEVVRRFSSDEEGTIVGQRPAKGKLRWGSEIRLVVSKGPRPVAIPEVVGLPTAEAKKILKDAGLVPVVAEAYSDEVKAGKVIAIAPGAGVSVDEGSEIEVTVSLGPEFKKVKMPDVRNMNVDAAVKKLEDLGLRTRVVQSCGGGGTVVSETDPIAGTTIRQNDLVALFVC